MSHVISRFGVRPEAGLKENLGLGPRIWEAPLLKQWRRSWFAHGILYDFEALASGWRSRTPGRLVEKGRFGLRLWWRMDLCERHGAKLKPRMEDQSCCEGCLM